MTILQSVKQSRSKKINKLEKLKALKSPLAFYDEFEHFCQKPYESIDDKESKYLLKCFGLYDKGPDNFMLRIRIPSGQLSVVQAIRVGEVSKKYGDNYLDITTRQQLELRFLKQKDLLTVLKRLEEVGLSTFQTGIDNFRNIVTSSFDGLSTNSFITCHPMVKKLQSIFLNKEEYFGVLPRKFNTAILGTTTNDCNIYGQDCAFVLARKGKEVGFNLYLGGKVGIQAYDSGLFIQQNQVEQVFKAIIDIFKTYGFRDNRNKNRLHFLIQAIGLERFINILKTHVKLELETSGTLLVDEDLRVDANGLIPLKDDKSAVHFPIPSGIFHGSELIEAAYIAQKTNGEIRLSVEQSFYLITSNQHIKYVKNAPIYKKYGKFQNTYFTNQIACAGVKTCPFGVIENKSDAIEMAYFLNEEVPLENAKVRMYWSACVKGCGIHGCADIGFEGCKVKNEKNETIGGVKILLGGKATKYAKEGRVLHKGLPLPKAQEAIKALMEVYRDERIGSESFEAFDTRVLSKVSTQDLCERIGV